VKVVFQLVKTRIAPVLPYFPVEEEGIPPISGPDPDGDARQPGHERKAQARVRVEHQVEVPSADIGDEPEEGDWPLALIAEHKVVDARMVLDDLSGVPLDEHGDTGRGKLLPEDLRHRESEDDIADPVIAYHQYPLKCTFHASAAPKPFN
jgi:hypothetical protein